MSEKRTRPHEIGYVTQAHLVTHHSNSLVSFLLVLVRIYITLSDNVARRKINEGKEDESRDISLITQFVTQFGRFPLHHEIQFIFKVIN